MTNGNTAPSSRGEHRGLAYWMERALKELEKVRVSPDPDAVHDLRVAIRRCRSVGAVMSEVDPDRGWPAMRKLARKLFRQLGHLRDTQILQEWTERLGDEQDPVRLSLLQSLKKQEAELREAVLAMTGKFDEKSWRKLERRLWRRSRLVPPDRLAAECLAVERLESVQELHVRAIRLEKPEAWHELRIGVKRFRYTVEALLPAKYAEWGADLKHLQDLLGEVHDLDVLSTAVQHSAAAASEEIRARWAGRVATERQHRVENYHELTGGKTGLWQVWHQSLPHGRRLEAAAMARLRVTARALDEDPSRTSLVSRLSLSLFDGLTRLHTSPLFHSRQLRKVMRAAVRLHGIGTGLDSDSPEKAARAFLRDLTLPAGWTEAEWDIMTAVVRYQRGPTPRPKHKFFARLPESDQRAVSALAGILRLARTLRKCGAESTMGFRVEQSLDAITVQVPGLSDSEQSASRLASGKYLLEAFLGTPLIIRAAPVATKIVQLPTLQALPPQSAAASD